MPLGASAAQPLEDATFMLGASLINIFMSAAVILKNPTFAEHQPRYISKDVSVFCRIVAVFKLSPVVEQ